MSDSPLFQPFKGWDPGKMPQMPFNIPQMPFAMPSAAAGAGWPMTLARTYWVDLPMALTSHWQRFVASQVQEQGRLFAELTTVEHPGVAFSKEMAFLQQSTLAVGAEMMELVELCQEKLINPAHEDTGTEAPTFKEAA